MADDYIGTLASHFASVSTNLMDAVSTPVVDTVGGNLFCIPGTRFSTGTVTCNYRNKLHVDPGDIGLSVIVWLQKEGVHVLACHYLGCLVCYCKCDCENGISECTCACVGMWVCMCYSKSQLKTRCLKHMSNPKCVCSCYLIILLFYFIQVTRLRHLGFTCQIWGSASTSVMTLP